MLQVERSRAGRRRQCAADTRRQSGYEDGRYCGSFTVVQDSDEELTLPSATAWETAVLPVLSEAEAAARARELGREVVLHRGRWWMRVVPGFYQPVHLLARLRPDEATRPTLKCWGLRASLAPDFAASANGSIPVHVLPDPRGYDIGRLAPSQRRKLRKHAAEFDIVALDRPDILLEQGYLIMREAHARNARVPLPERRQFERWAVSYFSPRRGLVLAALRHDRLLAFNTNSAVDGVAYGDTAYANAEGRRYALTTCLFHAFATVVSRCPSVDTLVDGLYARENHGLCHFKHALGLRVAHLPAQVWFARPAASLLRYARPHAYYRLTGRGLGPKEQRHLACRPRHPGGTS